MFQYLVFVGGLAVLIGASSYAWDTYKGTTKPNRVTWFLWAVAPMIATVGGIAAGAGLAVLPVFMSGFGPLIVFLASFSSPHAYWKLGTFDYVCGVLSILTLVLWMVTKEPVVAIVLAIASDGLAALPTVIKAWRHPETESSIAYGTGMFNALTSFAAIKAWTFSAYAFPVYLIVANGILLFAIYRRIFVRTRL